MIRAVGIVKSALGGWWSQLTGNDAAPAHDEKTRLSFEREYDAIIAEMAAALVPVNASRRTAERGR